MELYPLLFEPILKERVWGGRGLEERLGRRLPPGKRIGESWELVDRPADSSVVRNGPLAGKTLHDLCQEMGPDLLGERGSPAARFPLIVKLLDPNDKLSIQVHPTADYVARHPEAESPKSEAWFSIDARPDASIVHGLAPGVTTQDLRQALDRGDIESLLCFVRVVPDGFYCIPSGLVHALLPGSLMVEVQQNCDTTFRLYDWGRAGLDGKPRPLHTAEALECVESFLADPELARYEAVEAQTIIPGVRRAGGIACPSFLLESVSVDASEHRLPLERGSFSIFVVLEGPVEITDPEKEAIAADVRDGETVLVPACLREVRIRAERGAKMLRAAIPRLSHLHPNATRG